MAKFFDVSEWNEKKFLNTGGTRNKCVVEEPNTGQLYYFKTSLKKEVIDYKYEFWSEIIASEIGRHLGFNMLVYDIACKGEEIGCLSQAMNKEGEELREGIRYLTSYDNTYLPEDKSQYAKYTFQFICDALKMVNSARFIDDLIRTIVFDSIVGNGDRHQENWGILVPQIQIKKFRVTMLNNSKARFAPIYDSGSCLGREMEDSVIPQMLKDAQRIEAYIKRGTSEIRWNGPRLSHFELISKLRALNNSYKALIDAEINRVSKSCKVEDLQRIVNNVDINLPQEKNKDKLPQERKEFIIKLITLRVEKLKEVL